MTRKEKDIIINKLLFVTGFSIIASTLLWFIFLGYLHTYYILAMPKIMITILIISVITAFFLGWKVYTNIGKMPDKKKIISKKATNRKIVNKKVTNKYIPYLIISIVIALSSLAIKYYILYAIYVLWIIIAVYLIGNFIYGFYKLATK